jgi:hypothetical protein
MNQIQNRFEANRHKAAFALFIVLSAVMWGTMTVKAFVTQPFYSTGNQFTTSKRCCNFYNDRALLRTPQQRQQQINSIPIPITGTSKRWMIVDPNMMLTIPSHMTIAQSTAVEITTTVTTTNTNNDIGMLSKEATVIIFIIGIIPFIIATYEFWRRIAVGATFGTGTDSVTFPTVATIGKDNAPSSSRGKQVLGQDSLITAYIIFATVAAVLGIVFYAVITSPPPS